MTDSFHEQTFVAPKGSFGLRLVAGISALAVTVAVFIGYAYLRRRHAENSATALSAAQTKLEPKKSPKAIVLVDDALMQGSKTIVGGTVRNTSAERFGQVSVELELTRRKDGTAEKKLIALTTPQLEPGQEGRYSLELKAQEYGSARLVGLRVGPDSSPLAYTAGPGQKRLPERLESKTIIVNKPSSKGGGFLNSPDNPARVP
jgi:hypothetical protein